MENQNAKRTLLDEHLDFMIRLAYRREEERLLQKLAQDAQRELTSEEIAAMQRGYDLFLEKHEALEKQKRRAERILQMKKIFSQIGRIAAAFIIFLAIAAPIAIAAIEPVRAKVLTLLIDVQERYTRLEFIDPEEPLYVPEGWSGTHFPAYLPGGFEVHSVSDASVAGFVSLIQFTTPSSGNISFSEHDHGGSTLINTENTVMSLVDINGETGNMFEKEGYCVITWSIEDKLFILVMSSPNEGVGKVSSEECLRIARSVRKIPE